MAGWAVVLEKALYVLGTLLLGIKVPFRNHLGTRAAGPESASQKPGRRDPVQVPLRASHFTTSLHMSSTTHMTCHPSAYSMTSGKSPQVEEAQLWA